MVVGEALAAVEIGKKAVEGTQEVLEAVKQGGTQVAERIANPAEVKAIIEQTASAFPAKGVALIESVKTDGLSPEQIAKAKADSGVETKVAAENEKVNMAAQTAKGKIEIFADEMASFGQNAAIPKAAEVPPPTITIPEVAIAAAAPAPEPKSSIEEFADEMASFGHPATSAEIPPPVIPASPIVEAAAAGEPQKRTFDMGIEQVAKTPSPASLLYKSITDKIASRFNKINDKVNAIDAKYVQPMDNAIIEAGSNLAAGTAKKFEQAKVFITKVQERRKVQKEKYNKLDAYGKFMADVDSASKFNNPLGLVVAMPKFLVRFAGERLKEFAGAQMEAKKKYHAQMDARKMQLAEEKKVKAEKIALMKSKRKTIDIFDKKQYYDQNQAYAQKRAIDKRIKELGNAGVASLNEKSPSEEKIQPTAASETGVESQSVVEETNESIKIPEVVSDQVYNGFTNFPKEKYKVPDAIIEMIAQKLKDFKQLSPRELAIQREYGQEINTILAKGVEVAKPVEAAPALVAATPEKQVSPVEALKQEAKAKFEAAQAEYEKTIKELEGTQGVKNETAPVSPATPVAVEGGEYYTQPAEAPTAANNYGYAETGPNAADNYGYAEQNTEAANNYGYSEQPAVTQPVAEAAPAEMSDAERIAKFTQIENERKQKEQESYDQRSREIVGQQNTTRAVELNNNNATPAA